MAIEDQELRQRIESFISAWNTGDAERAAEHFAQDAERVGAFGEQAHGREEIRGSYQALLGGIRKGAQVSFAPSARMLTATLALVKGPLTIEPPDGSAPLSGYSVDIWEKRDGRWVVVEAHPKLIAPRD